MERFYTLSTENVLTHYQQNVFITFFLVYLKIAYLIQKSNAVEKGHLFLGQFYDKWFIFVRESSYKI